MKTTRALAAAAVLALSGTAIAQPVGITRTDALRHDLHHGHEAIQVRVDFAPGVSFPFHSHPGVELAYVLEGSMEYQLEGKPPVILKAGESLFIPAGVNHSARAVGPAKAAELATYLVEKNKPILVLAK